MKKSMIKIITLSVTLMCLVGCNGGNNTDSNKSNDNSVVNIETKEEVTTERNEENSKQDSGLVKEKAKYLQKLDDIQQGLSDLDSLYAGNTLEMKQAASEEYSRWDKALNEIYAELKAKLPQDKMDKLQEEEIKWIDDKENNAKKESKKFEGGTMEGLTYLSCLAQSTKDRCYELVNNYME